MKQIIISLIVAVIVVLVALSVFDRDGSMTLDKKETLHQRVTSSGQIRCGHFTEPPFTIRDAVTGELSGISVSLVEKIASDLGLEVVWKEPIAFSSFPQDLNQGKYDMICGSILILPRAGSIDYSNAYAYAPMVGIVKNSNENFDKEFDSVDWSSVTVAGIDGEGATTIVKNSIPEAKLMTLPQSATLAEMLLTVESGKTDIAFVMPSLFDLFNENNPGKLKIAKLSRPLYRYGVSFGIPRGEFEFKRMIDNVIEQYRISGELGSLIEEYDQNGYFGYPSLN